MPTHRGALVQDLSALGVRAGDIVMVHASVRSVGPIHGGPDQIHLAIEDAVRPGGAVMMVVDVPEGYDDVGRGVYTQEQEAEILEHQPPFDPRATRANRENGTLAEFFRSYPGAVFSATPPGRMAARGDRAAWLVADQPWNYSFGAGSPLEKLCNAGGKVLLLGSDHDQVTLLHYAEFVADFPDKRIARYRVPMLQEGQRVWVPCEEFDTTDTGVHPNWPHRFFARIVDAYIERYAHTPLCATGRVGNADSVLIDAATLVAHAIPVMIACAKGRPFDA